MERMSGTPLAELEARAGFEEWSWVRVTQTGSMRCGEVGQVESIRDAVYGVVVRMPDGQLRCWMPSELEQVKPW